MLKKNLTLALLLFIYFTNEPSLSAQSPIPINYGQSIVGNLPFTSSTASFETPFAQPGDVLMVRAVPSGLMSLKVELYSPSGQFLMEYFANASRIVHFFFTIPPGSVGGAGDYRMIVSATDGFFTGDFCLFLQRVNAPPSAFSLNCNSSLSDGLDCTSSVMSFRYIVQEGSLSRITINSNGLSTPEAWLCSSDGAILRYGLAASGYSLAFDSIVAPYTGCYFVFVTDFGAFFNTSGFNVSHTLMSGACAAPSVQTMPANGNVCTGSPFYLSASSPLPGASYSWSGPNGFTSTEAYISFYEAMDSMSGAYAVTVTAPGVCPVVLTRAITVKPLPVATANVTPAGGSLCAEENFQLNVMHNASGSPSYRWEGPNYTSIQRSPIRYNATPGQSGYYHISVTDGNGCVGTDSVQVTVHALPEVVISQPADGSVCLGSPLQLYAQTNASGASFSWTGPNGFSSTLQNPQIPNAGMANAGTYHVTVTDVNRCSDNGSKYISVWNLPMAGISPSSPSICLGDSIRLTASGGIMYEWSTGETTKEIIVRPLETTTYSVTVTDSRGCSDDENATVTVNPLPSITATSQPTNAEICSGSGHQILLTAMSPDANNPIWEWTKNGSFFSNNQFISLSNSGQSGIYIASVTDDRTGCSNTALPISVNIYQTPTVSLTQVTTPPYYIGDDFILCASSNATGPSYEWEGPNGFTNTSACAMVNSLNPLNAGIYSVTVTDIHGCQGFAVAEIEIIVGTVEPAEAWGLTIAPNPNDGIAQIRTDKPFPGKLEMVLFDANGRRIRSFWMETPTLTLDMTDLANGFYILRISDGEKAGAMRLAVIR